MVLWSVYLETHACTVRRGTRSPSASLAARVQPTRPPTRPPTLALRLPRGTRAPCDVAHARPPPPSRHACTVRRGTHAAPSETGEADLSLAALGREQPNAFLLARFYYPETSSYRLVKIPSHFLLSPSLSLFPGSVARARGHVTVGRAKIRVSRSEATRRLGRDSWRRQPHGRHLVAPSGGAR